MEIEEIKKQVEKQIENPDWGKIKATADEKGKQFGDMISPAGIFLVAVRDVYPDFELAPKRSAGADYKGRLVSKTRPRIVPTKKNNKQAVREVFIAIEEMGVIQATLWGKSQVELFKEVEHNDPVILKDVKLNTKNGETVLNFFKESEVDKLQDNEVKPMSEMLEDIRIPEVKVSKVGHIKSLILNTKTIEFEVCPHCGQKLQELEGLYYCDTHEAVTPQKNKGIEITIDAGEPITSVIWQDTLKEGQEPDFMDIISLICRVYDGNHYPRLKAQRDNGISEEIAWKQFPREMKLTVYDYDLTEKGGQANKADSDNKGENKEEQPAISVEQV